MASYETEEIDVAKEFNLLPVIFETIQALQRTSDPQELTKKVATVVKYLCLLRGITAKSLTQRPLIVVQIYEWNFSVAVMGGCKEILLPIASFSRLLNF